MLQTNAYKIKNRKISQPLDQDQRVERERKEPKGTSSVQVNRTGSPLVIKTKLGRFFHFITSLPLSKKSKLLSLSLSLSSWETKNMKHELHLLWRADEHQRGGRRLNRATPPRRKPQPPPFKKNLTFFNILFSLLIENQLKNFKYLT